MGRNTMVADYQTRLFTVEEYEAMGRAGIFVPEERVELLDGEILTMAPIGPAHCGIVSRLTHLFVTKFGSRAVVRIQFPVVLGKFSEPQPDIALTYPRDDFYSARHPREDDVFALIEVAESSLRYDRGKKLKLYARQGIGDYRIVDIPTGALSSTASPMNSATQTSKRFVPAKPLHSHLFQRIPCTSTSC
ncbi:MAG: Uma2 family endonuclease [Candidatus Eremiobacteraeota bacterium]|nr:Uma2 family endonuclease [Candidatus Eremiobacteraeota bacterium]